MSVPAPSRSGNNTDRKDPRLELADRLIEQIEAGTASWQRPWEAGDVLAPVNAVTGKPYSGVNYQNLMMFSPDTSDPRWCTYKQAQEQGWQVRKGEHGSPSKSGRVTSTSARKRKWADSGNREQRTLSPQKCVLACATTRCFTPHRSTASRRWRGPHVPRSRELPMIACGSWPGVLSSVGRPGADASRGIFRAGCGSGHYPPARSLEVVLFVVEIS